VTPSVVVDTSRRFRRTCYFGQTPGVSAHKFLGLHLHCLENFKFYTVRLINHSFMHAVIERVKIYHFTKRNSKLSESLRD